MRILKPRRRRRPFIALRPADVAAAAPQDGGLFLGRLDRPALQAGLEEAGILAGLAERGYPDVLILAGFESGEHRLKIRARRGRVALVDVRLAETAALAEEPLMRRHGLEVLSFLAIHWLSLQHPKGRFSAQRPRLPGQRYPGLGLGKRLYERMRTWARDWGKDGLLNFPEYYHNAVFYSSLFRFLSPVRQGRFEALGRDLAALHVAAASAAVDAGRVREEPHGGVFAWEPGEMVAPLTRTLLDYLESDDYRRAVDAARKTARFRLA